MIQCRHALIDGATSFPARQAAHYSLLVPTRGGFVAEVMADKGKPGSNFYCHNPQWLKRRSDSASNIATLEQLVHGADCGVSQGYFSAGFDSSYATCDHPRVGTPLTGFQPQPSTPSKWLSAFFSLQKSLYAQRMNLSLYKKMMLPPLLLFAVLLVVIRTNAVQIPLIGPAWNATEWFWQTGKTVHNLA